MNVKPLKWFRKFGRISLGYEPVSGAAMFSFRSFSFYLSIGNRSWLVTLVSPRLPGVIFTHTPDVVAQQQRDNPDSEAQAVYKFGG